MVTGPQTPQWILALFCKRHTELSVLDGCILWGSRVVIPSVFHWSLLQELHTTHLGMSRMKSLARSYIWWPGLDSQIEELCRACVVNVWLLTGTHQGHLLTLG